MVLLDVEAMAVEVVRAAVSKSAIWDNEALFPVDLPRECLSRFEVSLGIDMAARGNQKQKRSVIDSRERLKYPSLMESWWAPL